MSNEDAWRRPGSAATTPSPASATDAPPVATPAAGSVDAHERAPVSPTGAAPAPDAHERAPLTDAGAGAGGRGAHYDGLAVRPAVTAPFSAATRDAAPPMPSAVAPDGAPAAPAPVPAYPAEPSEAPAAGAQFLRAPLALAALALVVTLASSCFFVSEAMDLSDAGDVGATARLVGTILAAAGNLLLALALAWIVLLLSRRPR